MDEIYTWIKNIVIYMIMNTIIMNLMGNKSYKKYISIVSGMILVLIVVSPLMNFMDLEDKLDYFLQTNDFAVETSDFKNDVNQLEKEQRDAILKEYLVKIKDQVAELLSEEGLQLEKFDASVDMDTASNTFGSLLGMKLTANVKQEEGDMKNDSLFIDKIEIDKIGMDEKKDTVEKVPSPIEINIKTLLSDFYNIEPDNINISVQGMVPG